MKKLILLSTILIIFIACSQTGKSPDSSNVDLGEKVYNDYCKVCHGLDGKLGFSGAFDLTTTKLSTQEKVDIVVNGRGAMIPYKETLSEEEIIAVVKHIDLFIK